MKKSSVIAIAGFAFVLALGLAACGGSSSGGAESDGSAADGAAAASAASDASAPAEAESASVVADSSAPADSASASASSDTNATDISSTSGTSAPADSRAEDPAKAEYDRACALFDEGKYYSAKATFENSGYEDWEQRAAECVQPMPETGELWHNEDMMSDNMKLEFVVNSEDESIGRYIAVYTADRALAASLFVNGSGTVETWIPGGDYYIKDATGSVWYGENELFGPDGHYETLVFDENESDRYLTSLSEGNIWTITINTASSEGQGVGSEEGSWEDWA